MSVEERADKMYMQLKDSNITINSGGTARFSNFHNIGTADSKIRELVNYLKENDMLIVVRSAPGNIKDEKDILYNELWTLNPYYETIPAPFFEQDNSIAKFYVLSPKECISNTQSYMSEQMKGFTPLKNVSQAIYKKISKNNVVNSKDSASTINNLITNYNSDQIERFLKLRPDDFAASFYDGKPETDEPSLANHFSRQLLKCISLK